MADTTFQVPQYPAPDSVAQHSMDWAYGDGNPLTDTTAPTAPVLSSSAKTATTVTLNWTASRDAGSGVASYVVKKNGTTVTTITNGAVTFQATGLTTATAYAFVVVATDKRGNSVSSNTLNVTTS